MTEPVLETVVLYGCETDRDDVIPDLGAIVVVSFLAVERTDDRVHADVGFTLAIPAEDEPVGPPEDDDDEDDDDALHVSAQFRLTYRMAPPRSRKALRAFALGRPLHDAWPAWVQWLRQTLALMGADQFDVGAQLPDELRQSAGAAFDFTERVLAGVGAEDARVGPIRAR
jgi:hypothetical protein